VITFFILQLVADKKVQKEISHRVSDLESSSSLISFRGNTASKDKLLQDLEQVWDNVVLLSLSLSLWQSLYLNLMNCALPSISFTFFIFLCCYTLIFLLSGPNTKTSTVVFSSPKQCVTKRWLQKKYRKQNSIS
jgi:hypothetical protein